MFCSLTANRSISNSRWPFPGASYAHFSDTNQSKIPMSALNGFWIGINQRFRQTSERTLIFVASEIWAVWYWYLASPVPCSTSMANGSDWTRCRSKWTAPKSHCRCLASSKRLHRMTGHPVYCLYTNWWSWFLMVRRSPGTKLYVIIKSLNRLSFDLICAYLPIVH